MKIRYIFGALFLVLVLLGLLILKACTPSPYKDQTLSELLVLYRTELDAPGLTVSDAAENLKTAKNALNFVRDEIVLSPYKGRQLSPDDVLRTRSANGLDKLALLGALLEQQGWQIGYVDADWSEAMPYTRTEAPKTAPSPVLKEIARRIDFDLAGLEKEWQAQTQNLSDIRTKIASSVSAVNQVLVNKTGYNPEYSTYTGNPLSRRYLVEATLKGRKKYFDPVYMDVPYPQNMRAFTLPTLVDPVVELRLRGEKGLEQSLLHWSGPLMGRHINLSFLPAIDTANAMAGPADPAGIGLWMPVLEVNGKTHIGKSFSLMGDTPGLAMTAPIPDPQAFVLADPSRANMLEIVSAEAENWPKVRLALKLVGGGEGSWVPAHFTIADNGQTVFPRLLNIDQSTKPVMVLTDVSGSMEDIGAFEVSKTAIISLASRLSPATPVALTSFAYAAREEMPLSPLGDGTALAKAARQLSTRDYTGIYAGLKFAASTRGLENGIVVLLSDGYDNVGGDEDKIIKALKDRNIRVFALALGADSDAKLLQRIAQKTDGLFAKIRKADELEPFYARLGSELTSYVMMEYDAPLAANPIVTPNPDPSLGVDDAETENASDERAHAIEVRLKDSSLNASGRYVAPQDPALRAAPRLLLHIEMPVDDTTHQVNRKLFDLGDDAAPWALTGNYVLMGDLGGFGNNRLTSAYVTTWINAIRIKAKEPDISLDHFRPTFDLVQAVNGFRALSDPITKPDIKIGAGPNLYLRRSTIAPGRNAPVRRRVFDVLFRAQRGYQLAGKSWDLRTGKAMELEVAGAIAEGWVIGGKNGVEALLANKDTLKVIKRDDPRPDWLAEPLRKISLQQHEPGMVGRAERLLVSPDVPDWAWVVDTEWEHNFRVLYGGNELLAKGASIEEIASQFDKIDKMYQIYEGAVGNLPGPYASTGAMLSAIASMKRQENKLWCYSTVMMGYVSQSIGDEDALLNQNAQGAKSKAAKLCKMQGAPDNAAAFIRKAALGAAQEGLKSWVINVTKEGVGGLAANSHSAWGIGGAVTDAAALYRANGASSVSPVTPAFHRAMANAVMSETTP